MRNQRRAILAICSGLLATMLIAGAMSYGPARRRSDTPLVVDQGVVSLGLVSSSEVQKAQVRLTNTTSQTINVSMFDTSCPCVRLGPLPLQVGPWGNSKLDVTFDPSEEPNFRGGLAVDATGLIDGGRVAFRTKVMLEVAGNAEPGAAIESATLR